MALAEVDSDCCVRLVLIACSCEIKRERGGERIRLVLSLRISSFVFFCFFQPSFAGLALMKSLCCLLRGGVIKSPLAPASLSLSLFFSLSTFYP